jgi:hypothetical protein
MQRVASEVLAKEAGAGRLEIRTRAGRPPLDRLEVLSLSNGEVGPYQHGGVSVLLYEPQ